MEKYFFLDIRVEHLVGNKWKFTNSGEHDIIIGYIPKGKRKIVDFLLVPSRYWNTHEDLPIEFVKKLIYRLAE